MVISCVKFFVFPCFSPHSPSFFFHNFCVLLVFVGLCFLVVALVDLVFADFRVFGVFQFVFYLSQLHTNCIIFCYIEQSCARFEGVLQSNIVRARLAWPMRWLNSLLCIFNDRTGSNKILHILKLFRQRIFIRLEFGVFVGCVFLNRFEYIW